METFGERVRRLRTEAEMTQEQLAKAAGVSQVTITNIENGRNEGSKHILALAKALKVEADFLQHGKMGNLARILANVTPDESDELVYVPYVTGGLSAGPGVANHGEHVKDSHGYTRRWIAEHGLSAPALRRIKIYGRSMEKTLFDGDVVLVNTEDKRIIDGKVYAFTVGDEARVKRLFRLMDGRIRVVSDNEDKSEYPDEHLTPDHMPEMIGRVVDRSGRANL